MLTREKIIELLGKKAKYAIGGGIATSVDYGIYFLLYSRNVATVYAQIAAYSISVIVNFLFQKAFVFELNRSARSAFALSMLVSGGGLLLSTTLIYLLNLLPFFQQYQLLAKLITSGLVFFYNFYCKRYVFEKRFL